MNDAELASRLVSLRSQSYPLSLDVEDGAALMECITRIMEYVPEGDRPLVRGDYDLATSSVCHPDSTGLGNSNRRVSG